MTNTNSAMAYVSISYIGMELNILVIEDNFLPPVSISYIGMEPAVLCFDIVKKAYSINLLYRYGTMIFGETTTFNVVRYQSLI